MPKSTVHAAAGINLANLYCWCLFAGALGSEQTGSETLPHRFTPSAPVYLKQNLINMYTYEFSSPTKRPCKAHAAPYVPLSRALWLRLVQVIGAAVSKWKQQQAVKFKCHYSTGKTAETAIHKWSFSLLKGTVWEHVIAIWVAHSVYFITVRQLPLHHSLYHFMPQRPHFGIFAAVLSGWFGSADLIE